LQARDDRNFNHVYPWVGLPWGDSRGKQRRKRAQVTKEIEMAAYWIGEHAIADSTKFEEYLSKVAPMIERFGGRYLTRVGAHEVLDGDWHPNRVVIIEFPDMETVRALFYSPEYKTLIALRQSAATDLIIAVEGK
jgi:uncharacterized protein (DUF1330 family)